MIINVKVKPNSKKKEIKKNLDGSLTLSLTSAPRRGKANLELIKLLGRYFKVSSSKIKIKRGLSSRKKVVEVLD